MSSGFGANDVRIVDTDTRRVVQTIPVPGASGGIALDSAHQLAYVSGLQGSRWRPSENSQPGARGNCVLVYGWSASRGQAQLIRTISLPIPAGCAERSGKRRHPRQRDHNDEQLAAEAGRLSGR